MIHFFELDPENAHTCEHCQRWVLDIRDGGYLRRCRLHAEVWLNSVNVISPNDCPDFLSVWQNDYRKRPDLQRKLDKEKGGDR